MAVAVVAATVPVGRLLEASFAQVTDAILSPIIGVEYEEKSR